MARRHTVARGECASSIAALYGFRSFRTVYDCPENAALRERRPDPNVLAPGDVVLIPDRDVRVESRPAEARHTFRTVSNRTSLHVRLKHRDVFSYELWVDGALAGRGTTDEAHPIAQSIDPRAAMAELRLWPDDLEEARSPENACVLELSLGALDPADEIDGVQQRLKNLGYYAGTIDGALGSETADAIRAFERDHGLSVTGALSPGLTTALLSAHDRT